MKIKNTIQCPKCDKEITPNNYDRHFRSCKGPSTKYVLDHTDLVCKFCGKEFPNTNSIVQHEIRCSKNPNRKFPSPNFVNKGGVPWNKGLTKETDERVRRNSEHISLAMRGVPTHKQSDETRAKISRSRQKFLKDNPSEVPYLKKSLIRNQLSREIL